MGNSVEVDLDGSWRFRGFSKLNGEESGAYMSDCPSEDWSSAEVPGTVHTDLIANNLISDPFKDQNEADAQWVSDVEWWYRKEIDLSSDVMNRQAVDIVFEGLDTFATIWVNGVKIGEANNMFTPWRFDIKHAVRLGKNLIAVRFNPIYRVAEELEREHRVKDVCPNAEYYSRRPYVRKAQYSFGWDFGPTLPTAGIWRGVKIEAYDKIMVGNLVALPVEVSSRQSKVKVAAEVHACMAAQVKARFVIEGFGKKIESWVNATVQSSRNFIECEFEIQEPRLWWPRGYGPQNLYEASVEVYSGDESLGSASAKVGIRSVGLLQEKDEEGKSFVLTINGIRIFCKGANWIPADSFLPSVSRDCYKKLLNLSAEANMNMLRVWGGGVYEDDGFYDMCDELGIMVWQDFMYACAWYPEGEWFLKEAEREAELAVTRLRGHACIVMWCGNNENQWNCYKECGNGGQLTGSPIFNTVLPRVCKRLDGTRPYWTGSPYGGEDPNSEREGDRHSWDAWEKGKDYPVYLEDNGRFISEFGWQAPPSFELLKDYTESKGSAIRSKTVEAHEKQAGGLEKMRKFLAEHYPAPEDFKLFTLYSQLNQGEALKAAITHWRSRMFKTSGCLIWQLNDCWPAISWSTIDYGSSPKPAFYYAKRAFQPVIAPLIVKDGKIYAYVINEAERTLKSTLKFQVMRFNGETKYSEHIETVTPPYTSSLVLERSLSGLPLGDDCIFLASLESDGNILCEDIRLIKEPKYLRLPIPHMGVEAMKIGAGKFHVRLESDSYAKAVWIKLNGQRAKFDDNFFDLVPKRRKTVEILLEKDVGLGDLKKNLVLEVYPYDNHAAPALT